MFGIKFLILSVFHNFNINYQEFKNASDYLTQKYIQLGIPQLPIYVTEWNAPSVIRDEPLSSSFMIKNQLEISKTNIAENCVAAWQDFSSSSDEFHNDYGLISYGGIHKPAYYSVQLSNLLKGDKCSITSSNQMDGIATISGDTLQILISNYAPPAIVEALNHTLFEGQFTINDLDQAGFIDISGNSLSPLDSLYQSLLPIGNATALEIAIGNAIPIYQHFDSLENRSFHLQLAGNTGFGFGRMFLIDSTQNNNQFKYDSLRSLGLSQSSAISNLLLQQNLVSHPIQIINGTLDLNLQKNAVCLIEIALSELDLPQNNLANFACFPNPSNGKIQVNLPINMNENSTLFVYDNLGKLVYKTEINQQENEFNFAFLEKGIYYLSLNNTSEKFKLILN